MSDREILVELLGSVVVFGLKIAVVYYLWDLAVEPFGLPKISKWNAWAMVVIAQVLMINPGPK